MMLLTLFSFLAGVVTILSPCILPILPVVLSSSVVGGKKRPFGIVLGFIASFTFFTLFLSSIVRAIGVSPDLLRGISVVVIIIFGFALVTTKIQTFMELLFSKLSRFVPKGNSKGGFLSGLLVGLSIGLLWTPCVGPILASVISLSLSGEVSSASLAVTLAYSFGTALPMFTIIYGGRNLLSKVPWLLKNTVNIQKIFGVLMILTAFAIFFNFDRKFQTFILNKFPNYGVGLTKFENNEVIENALEKLRGNITPSKEDMGKPVFELINDEGYAAPELIQGGLWFGSTPLTIKSLRGKVVLIDFWTYTCINCIRTLPYLKNWHEKYKDKGLVIIGVHTPEFEFEKNPENVGKAIDDFGIKYPVMQDNNYATWGAYNNRYWPAKYLIDKKGKIRYTHFGEGDYDETEKKIQELLSEGGNEIFLEIKNPAYRVEGRTPELYLGYGRVEFYQGQDLVKGKKSSYNFPDLLKPHHFSLQGEWEVGIQYAKSSKGTSLLLNFEAKEVFLVMRKESNEESKVRVFLDDKVVEVTQAGEDVKDGIVMLESNRLYKLIKLKNSGQHTLRLEFLDSNIELYAFTFG